MGATDKYYVELRNMTAERADYQFLLDDAFFAAIGGQEVHGGNIDVVLTVRKMAGVYELSFKAEGQARVTCDRCLDEMQLPIAATESLTATYDGQNPADDDVVVVPADDDGIDVGWYMYELVALAVPIKHVHPEGECNEQMSRKLSQLLCNKGDEAPDDNENKDKPVDPRWAALLEIDNNN